MCFRCSSRLVGLPVPKGTALLVVAFSLERLASSIVAEPFNSASGNRFVLFCVGWAGRRGWAFL